MDWSDYEVEGQISIFDLLQAENEEFNPLEALALHGSGFSGGMKRIYVYFMQNHSLKDKAIFLKNEYGIGGFGSPVKKPCVIHDMSTCSSGKDIEFSYYDKDMNDIHTSCTWEELAKTITNMIFKGKYKFKED